MWEGQTFEQTQPTVTRHYTDEGGLGSSDDICSVGRSNSAKLVTATFEHTLLLTIIMSNERPSDQTRIRKIAGSLKGKLSSLFHLSRAPTPSSTNMNPSSDNNDNVTK